MHYHKAKEKPKIWGTYQDRQYAIWKNLEKIYELDYKKENIIMPLFWGVPAFNYGFSGCMPINYGAKYIDSVLKFDGDSNYIDCGVIDHSNVITVSVCLKKPVGAIGADVVTKTTSTYEWDLLWGSDGYLYFRINGTFAGGEYVELGDKTHCLVGRYDKANIELWVDSIKEKYTAYTDDIPTTSQPVGIASRVGGVDQWEGSVYEVRVSQTIYTDDQIALFYNRPWDLYRRVGRPVYNIPSGAGIDETGKLISITSTISATDLQAYKDLQKLIAISSIISATDFQAYKETDRQVPITTTITGADTQNYIDTDKLVEIVSTIQGTDVQAYKDLNKQILITSTISSNDIQGFIEELLIGITSTISSSDLLSYNERNRTIPIAATISISDLQTYKDIVNILIASAITGTDIQAYKDLNLQIPITSTILSSDIQGFIEELLVNITSTVSSTDIQGFIEELLIGITATVSETDLLSYNERNRTIPISSSFTASDFQFYTDQGIVSIVCTISAADAMSGLESARVRMEFTVVPRTKEFTVVSYKN